MKLFGETRSLQCTILFLSLHLVFSSISSEFASRAKLRQSEDEFRLASTVYPVNYKLELMTILDPLPGYDIFTAPAKAWISIVCEENISILTLHAINLTIVEGSVTVRNVNSGTNVRIAGISYTPEYDFFHIELIDPAEVGETYEAYIEFKTPIHSDRLNGMYLDFYDNPDTGERNYIATTLFAPHHARRAFPCFDEPSFRATYDITVGHHTKYHAMSNADIISSRPIDNMTDWVWDTFDTTPSISSYIVAMIVSNLEFYEAPPNSFRNVTVRTYAKPTSIQQGAAEYSALTAGRVMTYFESLFIAEYPITKIYSVALPQFFFNAMENWGLITYKEPVLLYIPGETSEDDRYRINYVLSHEKAHQHFGNIVACNWWAYVWLKEGFATYYSHYGINHTNPELSPWEQFVPRVLQVAMEFDSSNETHPLENFPQTSASVADIYTRIPYEKGASILRMTSSMLTETVFLTAIQDYVETFKYKSATQNDLFEAFQRAVDGSPQMSTLIPASMLDIMNSWTIQAGYPVLTIDTVDATTLRISQEKYIDGDDSNPTDTWWVPVYISPRPNASLPTGYPDAWIPQNVYEITISISTDQLILINPGSVGYYRVLYNKALLQRILLQLNTQHERIPTSARSQILNDYFNFATTGQVEIQTALELTTYMEKEVDLSVWQSIDPFIDRLDKLLVNTIHHNYFQAYFGRVISKALAFLELSLSELEMETGEKIILSSLLGKLLCKLNHQECDANSQFWMRSWYHSSSTEIIPVKLQEEVFCGAARDSTAWNFLLSEYINITQRGKYSPTSIRILYGMTCSYNPALLDRILQAIISPRDSTFLPENSKFLALSHLIDNSVGKTIIMRRLQESDAPKWFLSIFHSRDNLRSFMNKIIAYDLSEQEIEMFINIADTASPSFQATIIANILKTRGSFDAPDVIVRIGEWLRRSM